MIVLMVPLRSANYEAICRWINFVGEGECTRSAARSGCNRMDLSFDSPLEECEANASLTGLDMHISQRLSVDMCPVPINVTDRSNRNSTWGHRPPLLLATRSCYYFFSMNIGQSLEYECTFRKNSRATR